ncbi:hypothetical protein [Thioalkalivibrio versutus]|uniref:hypothetical protein n=1 Tax=Thioalkalivibrio versutus TaxID=106634 RepID=UPI0003780541|nr:hypothetical protein [Thioalkalivibrio versutus]OOC49165.1 hypothetical protein B0684_06275 [Thioalkalivibrio versutus]
MDIPASVYIAIGAVLAALVAGFFSFLNLISSKENKVSEFRQSWIDGIREEVADFTAALQEVTRIRGHSNDNEEAMAEYHKVSAPGYFKATKALTKIQLRLNPVHAKESPESHEAKLLNALNSARKHFNNEDYANAIASGEDIRSAAAPFLKDEWERVKNGEERYQAIRDNALRTIKGGIALVIILSFVSLLT